MGPKMPLGSVACAVMVIDLPFLATPAKAVCLSTGGSSSAGPAGSAGATGAAGAAGAAGADIDSSALRVSSSTLVGAGAGAGAGAVVPFLPFLAEPFFGVVDFLPGAGAGAGAALVPAVPASGAVWAAAPRAKHAL